MAGNLAWFDPELFVPSAQLNDTIGQYDWEWAETVVIVSGKPTVVVVVQSIVRGSCF